MMADGFEIKLDHAKADRRLKGIPPTKEDMNVTLLGAIGYIKQQVVNDGRGYKGIFPAYSPSYIKQLQAAGQPTNVDLTVTGHMLQGFTALRVDATEAVAGFPLTQEREKALGVSKKRPFVGLDDKGAEQAARTLAAEILKRVGE